MRCRTTASSVASADVPTPPATAVEPELEPVGVWTGWMNNMNPYEEGQKGDLEITKNMDPVSSDRYWIHWTASLAMPNYHNITWDHILHIILPSETILPPGTHQIYIQEKSKNLGPIPETIRSRSAQIRSCDPDRPIAFHKRRSRSAHQIEKIRNQTVYGRLNHDINHSLGNLQLKLRGRDWTKNVRLMASIHDVTMGGVRRHLWVLIRERHGQFSARTQCLLTIQHGLDMPYLIDICMWLTPLKIYKLLTQDRLCSSKCFPVVCGF